MRGREVDANKQYASELLAILTQTSPGNQARLGQANGIDAVLQALAPYRNRSVHACCMGWGGGSGGQHLCHRAENPLRS